METNVFDQQTVCGAPICWLKYTTASYSTGLAVALAELENQMIH